MAIPVVTKLLAPLVVVLVIVVKPAITKEAFTLSKVSGRLLVLLDDHAFEQAFYRLSARKFPARWLPCAGRLRCAARLPRRRQLQRWWWLLMRLPLLVVSG